jgi:hypothetical protein
VKTPTHTTNYAVSATPQAPPPSGRTRSYPQAVTGLVSGPVSYRKTGPDRYRRTVTQRDKPLLKALPMPLPSQRIFIGQAHVTAKLDGDQARIFQRIPQVVEALFVDPLGGQSFAPSV